MIDVKNVMKDDKKNIMFGMIFVWALIYFLILIFKENEETRFNVLGKKIIKYVVTVKGDRSYSILIKSNLTKHQDLIES